MTIREPLAGVSISSSTPPQIIARYLAGQKTFTFRKETFSSVGLITTYDPMGSRYGSESAVVGFGRGSVPGAEARDERVPVPGAVVGDERRSEPGLEVTDGPGSAAEGVESIPRSSESSRGESESESVGRSLRRLFPDMGKSKQKAEKESLPSVT